MPQVYIGLIVHYVMADGTHRPAMVMTIYENGDNVDLWIFDNENQYLQPSAYRYDEPQPYTWHFIQGL